MGYSWVPEERPRWDDDKQRVVGGAPEGALDVSAAPGAGLPGDWWAATDDDGRVVGYGWLDSTWGGDAEILLAVAPDAQSAGVGSFVLSRLEAEAAARGMNYVYNTVRPTHPDRDRVHDWLAGRGYRGSDSDKALRKRVERQDGQGAAAAARPAARQDDQVSARPPGHEESGGYVDVDEHRY
jgi:GNAT superfamily N-acetyltransferase